MSVQYLYDTSSGIEVVFCEGTTFSYPAHNHVSVFTGGIVLRGAVVFTAGGAARICKAGACFAVPPYIPHQIEARGPYTLLTVCVPKSRLRDDWEALQAPLRRLLSVSGAALTRAQAVRLSEMLASFDTAPAHRVPPWVEQARARLEQRPEEAVCVADMARAGYISPCHFIRCFRRYVGLTPHQFQMQNRVRMGQRLLRTQFSSTDAALAAGFCDQSHFIRQFKKQVGLTPTAYQRACRALG